MLLKLKVNRHMKNKFKNNPVQFKDSRTEALEDAYNLFMEILKEYAESNSLSESNFSELKSLIDEAYIDKKISYFLDFKLDNLNEKIDTFVDFALSNPSKKSNYINLFYIKQTNHLITNE